MKYKDPVINQPFPHVKFLSGIESYRFFFSGSDWIQAGIQAGIQTHGEKAKLGQQKKAKKKRNCFGLKQKDSVFLFQMRCLHKSDFVGLF